MGNSQTVNCLSLFSGPGGCSLGLMQAGIKPVAAFDVDANACATYETNLGVAPGQMDLGAVSAKELLDHAGLDKGSVDFIVGGPPCQGFSSAGSRDWTDPRNSLLRNYVELIQEIRPTWFILENVEGLLTANRGRYFVGAVERLLRAGYWVAAKKLYAQEHGLPQRRKRVMIVGNLEQVDYQFPARTHSEDPQHTPLERTPTIMDAIGDLPPPADGGLVDYKAEPSTPLQKRLRKEVGPVTLHRARNLSPDNAARVSALAPGQAMKDLPRELQHPSFRRRAFRRVMDGTPTEKRGGAPSGIKRLIANAPSLTITSATTSEFVHPLENRLLTLREAARIQTFPDNYEFTGPPTSVATQIGNAIPPGLMEVIARSIQASATWDADPAPSGRWLGLSATKASAMSPILSEMIQTLEERTIAFA